MPVLLNGLAAPASAPSQAGQPFLQGAITDPTDARVLVESARLTIEGERLSRRKFHTRQAEVRIDTAAAALIKKWFGR